ncbi:MAG: ribonuclease HII [Acidimicrobiales bacterium]
MRPSRPNGKRGPSLAHERKLWRAGHQIVAGMDEVGRGAWAGPLSVGVAVMTNGVRRVPTGLRDSKQLAEPVRENMFDRVGKWCGAWAVGHSSPLECDALGMTKALRLAARRAFWALPPEAFPDAVVLDGSFDFLSPRKNGADDRPVDDCGEDAFVQGEMITDDPRITDSRVADLVSMLGDDPVYRELTHVELPDGRRPQVKTVIKGDDLCASVAAASVLAKVTRDRLMRGDAGNYPAFDFEQNKGYPSPSHKMALRGYGLTAIHRRTWAFVDWLPIRSTWDPQRDQTADVFLEEMPDLSLEEMPELSFEELLPGE